MSAITRILPKRSLSRFVGRLMHWRGPRLYARVTVRVFAWFYNINLNEAELPYTQYPSIGDFFIRKLKAGIRPVAKSWAVHPADSRITQAQEIKQGTLIQAKKITYTLKDFTQDADCMAKWDGGLFLTYYLCPTDYHRVHSPVDGLITRVRHIPGALWPVNEWSTDNVKNLFAVNERVLVEIETDLGPVGVVFVGATNVGHICLSFDSSIRGNQAGPQKIQEKTYQPALKISKGDELGMFRMGSTIVMLYPRVFRETFGQNLETGPLVTVNNALIK